MKIRMSNNEIRKELQKVGILLLDTTKISSKLYHKKIHLIKKCDANPKLRISFLNALHQKRQLL